MFKHSTDHEFTKIIDLRPFWRHEEKFDQFRIAINSDSVEQVYFNKTKNRFYVPGGREVLFSVTLPVDKINFLVPVKYDQDTGWSEPAYKLETHPTTVWDYPSYTRMECDAVFKNHNSYWKILSIGFPDLKNKWEVPKFKFLTEQGDYRLSIYHSRQQTFCTSDELKELFWLVSSYSAPVF